jgi:hypothetical protein
MKSVTSGVLYGYDKRKMAAFIDLCIEALHHGITLGTDGLFYSYIGNGHYIEQDPALGDSDTYIVEDTIRRRLEEYYIDSPSAMEMDREWLQQCIQMS